MKTLQERFWCKVEIGNPDECWEWLACKDGHGYGQIGYNSKSYIATHIAIFLTTHIMPSLGTVVLHSCDNPSCVNPSHLKIGTHADNVADRKAKGRSGAPKGAAHHSAKLTENQVKEIKQELNSHYCRSFRSIGMHYGVSDTAIRKIKAGKSWK